MKSTFFSLNGKDLFKGLIIAIIGALITGLYELFQAGPFVFDWVTFKPIVFTAVAAGLSYLIKNLFQNSEGEVFTKEP